MFLLTCKAPEKPFEGDSNRWSGCRRLRALDLSGALILTEKVKPKKQEEGNRAVRLKTQKQKEILAYIQHDVFRSTTAVSHTRGIPYWAEELCRIRTLAPDHSSDSNTIAATLPSQRIQFLSHISISIEVEWMHVLVDRLMIGSFL
jgi:hypothetical protein